MIEMITLYETYARSDGSPAVGSVAVKPVQAYRQGNRTIVNEWTVVPLDDSGHFEYDIYPHDNTQPTPIHYMVIEMVPDCGLRQHLFALPSQITDGTKVRIGDYRDMAITNPPPSWTSQNDKNFYGWGADPATDQYAAGGLRAGMTPAKGEARFFGTEVQIWDGNQWVDEVATEGDEYIDLDSRTVYAVHP